MPGVVKAAWTILAGASAALALWVGLAPDPGVQAVVSGYTYPLPTTSSAALRGAVQEAIALRTRQLLDHELHLSDRSETFAVAAQDLGYGVDQTASAEQLLQTLSKLIKQRSAVGRVTARLLGKPLVVRHELAIDFDPQVARERLERLRVLVERPAVDAQLLVAEHEILPSQMGQQLSIEGSLVRLGSETQAGERVVELSLEEIEPTVTEAALAPVDVTRVLSSYETSFRGKAGPRAVNIRAAGRYLNGAVLLPGETLSFNSYVGRRVHGRGFVDAPVIVNDELEEDVGGGVCQVATTLHAAAIFGALQVVARRSHSRPSGYAPLGLDATVIDGKVDLQLRNPYAEPLLVYVSFPSAYVIRVELLGRLPEKVVRHEYAVTHREPYARRIWNKSEMKPGTFEKKQKGIEGMDVVSVLTMEGPDGQREKRSYHSKYYPVPEVFWLGEGVLQAELPRAADSVSEIVVDGIESAAEMRRGSASETREEPPPFSPRNEVL